VSARSDETGSIVHMRGHHSITMQTHDESDAVRNYLEALTRGRPPRVTEDDFVDAAYRYGQRRGICYAAWREVGVDATVLQKAGITPPA